MAEQSYSVMPNPRDFSFSRWPVYRQWKAQDVLGLDGTAASTRTESLKARIEDADQAVASVCPYCAVGCGQMVYVKDGKIIDIEGDPRSPISHGCLCPKGRRHVSTGDRAASRSNTSSTAGRTAPSGRQIPLEQAMDMVAERVKETRDDTWEDQDQDGNPLRRTMAIAHLGGATLDNEENYLIKKLFTALGIVQIENQARI